MTYDALEPKALREGTTKANYNAITGIIRRDDTITKKEVIELEIDLGGTHHKRGTRPRDLKALTLQ